MPIVLEKCNNNLLGYPLVLEMVRRVPPVEPQFIVPAQAVIHAKPERKQFLRRKKWAPGGKQKTLTSPTNGTSDDHGNQICMDVIV